MSDALIAETKASVAPSASNLAPAGEADLCVTLEGFSGPIDLLLQLARDNKMDLSGVSMLALAEQYLVYIAEVSKLRLDIAADYLVMAAWLAYLKSRLLLPETKSEEPRGADMADALAYQLKRLEAMQDAGARLLALPQKGRDVFAARARGPEGHPQQIIWTLKLLDLLDGVVAPTRRRKPPTMTLRPQSLYSLEEARRRVMLLLAALPGWRNINEFLPDELTDLLFSRSAMASTFVAALELAKQGNIELQQHQNFGEIFLRARPPENFQGESLKADSLSENGEESAPEDFSETATTDKGEKENA